MWINSSRELKMLFATLSVTVVSIALFINFQSAFSQSEDVSYLDVNGTNSAQLSKFSVAAWFKTSSDYTSDAFIVNRAGSSDNMNYGIWMTNAEKIRGGFETTSGSAFFTTTPLSYNDGIWHYAVVTFDGSAITLYLDGLPVATKTASASPDSGGEEPIRMGADSQNLGNYFIGNVDEVRIWNNALTSQQVIDAFNGNFNPQNLIEYLDFSEPIVPVNATAPVNATEPVNATVTNQTGIPDNNGTLNNGTDPITIPASDNGTSSANDTGAIIPPVEIPQTNNDTDSNNDTSTGDKQEPPSQNQQNEQNNVVDDNSTQTEENANANANTNANTNTQAPVQLNQIPKADAGDDRKVEVNTEVKLDAGDSKDQDGEIVSYKWEHTDGPEVELKDSDKQVAVFDVPESAADSNLEFKLTVTDDKDDTGEDEVTVEVAQVQNVPPKADAGDDRKVEVNTEVKLDAGDSKDQDGEIVSYKWEQTDGPEVELKDFDKQVAVFDVPESAADSNLEFKLTVTDDKDDTAEDEVTIEVEPIPEEESDTEGESN